MMGRVPQLADGETPVQMGGISSGQGGTPISQRGIPHIRLPQITPQVGLDGTPPPHWEQLVWDRFCRSRHASCGLPQEDFLVDEDGYFIGSH